MHTLQHGYRGLGLLLTINWDRLLYVAVIVGALYFGAFLGSL
ncbi:MULTISPECIES: hypothetical protein [Salipiger]|mgnify:CR=1 FL=1|jgi:hypothetical protein|uniref:Uncharacterized protein n=1 Tax=Salipiger profundus TaxID=1229727 RepID=A0A1U7DA24_9RHOB|nr:MULTISPECIES: hypothetical protein [Salipiger]APX25014.1 hypothetical protein Ga0080559_TMP4218 [Salipiger profundus]SFD12909.1 hypothetical protein SAMN05444415_107279 [Salipiger profundus]|tara:strand:- start:347 stop:472 length:126 start_codon:yes stop_codon:yes gene_type:complete